MTGNYLDASVLVPLIVEQPLSEIAAAFMDRNSGRLLASEFAAAEAASAISRLVRMGELDAELARAALEDFDAWRFGSTKLVEMTPGDVRLAHGLVRRFETKLRAADALHVAMTIRLGATLVTDDAGMLAGAEMVGVAAVGPV